MWPWNNIETSSKLVPPKPELGLIFPYTEGISKDILLQLWRSEDDVSYILQQFFAWLQDTIADWGKSDEVRLWTPCYSSVSRI